MLETYIDRFARFDRDRDAGRQWPGKMLVVRCKHRRRYRAPADADGTESDVHSSLLTGGDRRGEYAPVEAEARLQSAGRTLGNDRSQLEEI